MQGTVSIDPLRTPKASFVAMADAIADHQRLRSFMFKACSELAWYTADFRPIDDVWYMCGARVRGKFY